MPARAGVPAQVLSNRALNRALLARQLLLRRSPMAPLEAIEHLAGLQSQAPLPPYYALWARLEGFQPEALSALIQERRAVRIVLMRGTIHLVSAEDCLAFRPVLQPVLERMFRGGFGKRLVGLDVDVVAEAGRALVEEAPRSFAELTSLLQPRWPEHDPSALAQAVRTGLALVQVPPRGLWRAGGPASHTTAERWLDRPLGAETAPDALVLRYLGAFGPATVKDVQAWSGLTHLGAVMERLDLRTFRDETGATLYDLPDAPLPSEDTPAPVRFLGEFDSTLLAYADRSRIMTREQQTRVFTVNGIIRATILVDGFVGGMWRIEQKAGTATLLIEPFSPLGGENRNALEEEGARLLSFAVPGERYEVRSHPAEPPS
jgi:hypothetical protein